MSGFALVEIAYAVEKARIHSPADADRIIEFLRTEESPFEVVPVDLAIGETYGGAGQNGPW